MLSRKLTRRGRQWLTAFATASLIAGLLGVGSAVYASTPANQFELEGNATSASGNTGTPPDDWDRVCHQVLNADCSTTANTNGAVAVAWADDAAIVSPGCAGGNNCTIFTGGGSKDPIDISSWAWKTDTGGLPDKDNLTHGFAARYSIPSSPACPGRNPDGTANTDGTLKCEMLYFGNARFDNSGDAQQGFWFFQNKIGLGSTAQNGGFGFTGVHRNGDLLLISDFTNGGDVSTITVYTWDSTCKKAVTKPVPGDCGDANLRLQATSDAANCSTVNPATGGFCGIVNPTNGTPSPWPYTDKSGNHTYLQGELYEGGVNLSALNLGGECFASIASETRSSQSTTATLKDFVLGGFGNCESGIVTTPRAADDSNITSALSIGANARVDVKDHAVVTVNGVTTWAGSVAFTLCGPLALDSTSNCKTGGVSITPSKSVSNTTPTTDSPTVTLTSAGRYCWRANFTSTTTGVPASADPPATGTGSDSTSECFLVEPVQPTLSTTGGADVALGNAITDTANLSGTAKQPGTDGVGPGGTINASAASQANAGGTITWRLFGPDNCTTEQTLTSNTATVNGDNTSYGPVSFTPTAIGKYTWVASYDGSSPNTLSAGPSSCPPGANDGDEEVVVTGSAGLSTAQDWLPNDTATLTGPVNLNGTLTFQLYSGDNCGATSGSAVSGQLYTVTVTNKASGSTFSTSNTTFKVTAGASYSWKVTYDDNVLTDPAPSCEKSTLTITN
jgi:hypothetical protein